jgi:hypothetical protein
MASLTRAEHNRPDKVDLPTSLNSGTAQELHEILAPTLPPPIFVHRTQPIQSHSLLRRLQESRILLGVAVLHCRETIYTFGKSPLIALSFQNQAGGLALWRGEEYYLLPPIGPTLIRYQSRNIAVFERFYHMLAFVSILYPCRYPDIDLLVLNEPALFSECQCLLDEYHQKHLFPVSHTTMPMANLGASYVDQRPLYKGYNDLFDWASRFGRQPNKRPFPNNFQHEHHATNPQ